MTTYQIQSQEGGGLLGPYDAETPEGALRAMLDDAGCHDAPTPRYRLVDDTDGPLILID